jgi:predicted transcriptional regulator
MPSTNPEKNKPTKGLKHLYLASILIIVLILILGYPTSAQGTTITVELDKIEQTADFTVDSQISLKINGNLSINHESAIPATIWLGIHAPDGWETSITPDEVTVAIGTTVVSFEGEVKPSGNSLQKSYDVFVWASVDDDKPAIDKIVNGDNDPEPSVFSVKSLIEVIKNRIKLATDSIEHRVLPDSVITQTYSVSNIGTVSDIFYITLLGDEKLVSEGWLISQSEINLSMAPGEEKTFTVEQIIPEDTQVGDYEIQVLVSSSSHAASESSHSLATKVRVPQIAEPFNFLPFLFIAFIGTGLSLAAFFGATEIGYLALMSLFLPLYVRLKKKDVLSHFTRGQIFGYIQANPGAHYNAIIQYLGLQNGVGAYHLKVLEREGYIKSFRDGIYKRFYPKSMRIPEKRLHLSRIQRDILDKIQKHPGITQKQIAKLLEESKQVINYNVKVLENAGLIRMERIGRESACFAGNVMYVPEEDVYKLADDPQTAQMMNI